VVQGEVYGTGATVIDRELKRFGLERMEIPREQTDAVMSRIEPLISFFLSRKYILHEIDDRVRNLARDCYTQGLIDGAQSFGRRKDGAV
jgi:hypothetical protein